MTTERQAGSGAADGALLLVRLALGVIFFAHGAQKLFGWWGGYGIAATVDAFQKNLGIPPALTWLAALTETFGGLAVIVGLLPRAAALGLAVTMLVAIFRVHLQHGFFLARGGEGSGIEYNLALLAMSLAIVVAGAGRLALPDVEAAALRRLRRPS